MVSTSTTGPLTATMTVTTRRILWRGTFTGTPSLTCSRRRLMTSRCKVSTRREKVNLEMWWSWKPKVRSIFCSIGVHPSIHPSIFLTRCIPFGVTRLPEPNLATGQNHIITHPLVRFRRRKHKFLLICRISHLLTFLFSQLGPTIPDLSRQSPHTKIRRRPAGWCPDLAISPTS